LSGLIVSIDTALHSATGNLEFFIDPAGVSDTLIYQVGGTGQDFIHARLFDGAEIPIALGTPPFSDFFLPHTPLILCGIGSQLEPDLDGVAGNTRKLEARGLRLFFEPVINIENTFDVTISEFFLHRNYPNPFKPITEVNWHLPTNSQVKLNIYNLRGQKVASLIDQRLTVGSQGIRFKVLDWPAGYIITG
jgi:hypothetical protein